MLDGEWAYSAGQAGPRVEAVCKRAQQLSVAAEQQPSLELACNVAVATIPSGVQPGSGIGGTSRPSDPSCPLAGHQQPDDYAHERGNQKPVDPHRRSTSSPLSVRPADARAIGVTLSAPTDVARTSTPGMTASTTTASPIGAGAYRIVFSFPLPDDV